MPAQLKPLNEQVIVITGASSGIGLATALLAAENGASVALIARSVNTLEDIAEHINEAGGSALAIAADVGDRQQLGEAADAVINHFGRIDTWVNNAGISIYGRLQDVQETDSRRLFETNFWGVVHGSLIALEYLKTHGGALINVGSEVSEAALPLQGMYTASKHAVKGFTDTLRVEIERLDEAPVSITLIQPTAVNTPYPEHARNYLDREPKLPTPQIDPTQVARAILRAATKGGRDVKVGTMARLSAAMSKLAPTLADRIAAHQAGRQQRDLPAQHRYGALYAASESGRIHGAHTP